MGTTNGNLAVQCQTIAGLGLMTMQLSRQQLDGLTFNPTSVLVNDSQHSSVTFTFVGTTNGNTGV